MLPLLVDQGVSCVPWSPLARGLLARAGVESGTNTLRSRTDNMIDERYENANPDVLASLAGVAREYGLPSAQIALAWLLRQPAVTSAVVGVAKTSHVDDAVSALDIKLSEDELVRLSEHYRAQEVVGHE